MWLILHILAWYLYKEAYSIEAKVVKKIYQIDGFCEKNIQWVPPLGY